MRLIIRLMQPGNTQHAVETVFTVVLLLLLLPPPPPPPEALRHVFCEGAGGTVYFNGAAEGPQVKVVADLQL